jgi:hypothetical protein
MVAIDMPVKKIKTLPKKPDGILLAEIFQQLER